MDDSQPSVGKFYADDLDGHAVLVIPEEQQRVVRPLRGRGRLDEVQPGVDDNVEYPGAGSGAHPDPA